MSNEITVRPAGAEDLDTIVAIRAAAFESDEARIRAGLDNNPRYNYGHYIIGQLEGKPVGAGVAFPIQMWISGVPIQMGAVADVGTLPDYQNRGVATAMMEALLQNMARDGMAISALFPAAQGLYRRLGYADAAVWHDYSVAPDNIPDFEEARHVRPFAPDDLPAMRSIYRGGQLSQADGRLTRSNSWWERLVTEDRRTGGNHLAVYDAGEGVEGYASYTLNDDGVLKVHELIVYSDAAYRGLWRSLAARPGISAVNYLAPADDPLLHLMVIPRDSRGGNRGWIFDDICHVTSAIMIRIIDLAEALTSRFYPHDMMGNRVIKLHDPQLLNNEEPLNFRIVDGRPDLIPVEGKTPQIEADVATFSQIFCGYLSPEMARRLGKLQADDETVEWLGKAMAARPLFIHKGDWF